MGCAFQFAHAGYVAYVVQVSVGADKKLKIDKAFAAIDIGSQIINTLQAESLVQGGFIEGMSHLMRLGNHDRQGSRGAKQFQPLSADAHGRRCRRRSK